MEKLAFVFQIWTLFVIFLLGCMDLADVNTTRSKAGSSVNQIPGETCCQAVLCLSGEGDDSSNILQFCGKIYPENIDFLRLECRLEWIDLADACDN